MRVLAATAIVIGAVAAHFYAMHTGIYAAELREGFVWFDNVLHACVGFAFGLLWLSVQRRLWPNASTTSTIASMVLFVLVIAGLWELFEYGFYLVFKSGALGLTVYEPSIWESVYDSLSNVAGAIIFIALWLCVRVRSEAIAE